MEDTESHLGTFTEMIQWKHALFWRFGCQSSRSSKLPPRAHRDEMLDVGMLLQLYCYGCGIFSCDDLARTETKLLGHHNTINRVAKQPRHFVANVLSLGMIP